MVAPDGAAVIAYADGCTVDVKPGTVETIAQLSPCASGASAQNQDYGNHWCVAPANPTDYNNPSYCAGVPVTAAVLALLGLLSTKLSVLETLNSVNRWIFWRPRGSGVAGQKECNDTALRTAVRLAKPAQSLAKN